MVYFYIMRHFRALRTIGFPVIDRVSIEGRFQISKNSIERKNIQRLYCQRVTLGSYPSLRLKGRLGESGRKIKETSPFNRNEGAGAWGRIRATNKTSFLTCKYLTYKDIVNESVRPCEP
jgi:hypothetical protein